MSIQSEITRIQNSVSGQSDLLSQIQSAVDSLPDASGGSGGSGASYDACTVTINAGSGMYITGVVATKIINGVFEIYRFGNTNGVNSVTVENVLCNSAIVARAAGSTMCACEVTGGVKKVGNLYSPNQPIFAASSDGTATIYKD